MKVLIIDDDEAMIGIWSTVLKKESIEVLTAGSGKLGIELATKNIPDFILLDQIITDMKGNDVLKQLKSNPATVQIPVALVSNYSEPEMMHEAIESGAIDYILKYQIDPSDLANKIKTLLHGTKPLNPAATALPGQQTASPDEPAQPTPQPQIIDPTVVPQPQVVNPSIPQPQVIQPGQAIDQMQTSPVQPTEPPIAPQPIVVDPTKPIQ